MGIISRMLNMGKAKANKALDDIENPIELLDQKIRDMEEQLNKAKLSSAQVLGNTHTVEKQLTTAKQEVADYESKVSLALSKGNEDLAKRALAKKIESDKKVASLTASYEQARKQSDTLKANLSSLEQEIAKTRSYRDEAAARYENAKAGEEVMAILADVKTKTNNTTSIDSIERNIQKKEAMAAGLSELRDTDDFDSEFKKLDEVDLDAELEKYKNK